MSRLSGSKTTRIAELHLEIALQTADSAVVLQRGEVVQRAAGAALRADDAELVRHLAP